MKTKKKSKKSLISKWKYQCCKLPFIDDVNSIDDMPYGVFGFVYEMTINGKIYIGKKQVSFSRRRLIGKREKEKTKTRKKYKIVLRESDWKDYTSSSEEVNKLLNEGHRLERIIIDYAFDAKELTYLETKYQFCEGAIEKDNYLNNSILGKFYRKK